MTAASEAPAPGTAAREGAAALGLRARFWRSEELRGLTLISPTFLYALLLLLTPILVIIAFSFWTQNYLDIDHTPTLQNYREAWTDPLYRVLMFRSLGVSALVTLITVVLAYPMAYYLSFHVTHRKALWLFLITIPFWTSYLLRVFAWKLILGYDGVINSGLKQMGLLEQPLEFLLYNQFSVVVTLAHAWVAFAILPIYVSMEKIDRSLLEAASDLGDSPWRRFWRITFPLSLPGLVAAALLVFIPTVGDYVTPALVGGTDGIMLGSLIQTLFGKVNNMPLGAASALMMMLTVTLLVCLFLGGVQVVRKLAQRV